MKLDLQQIKLEIKEYSTGRNALFLLFAAIAFMMAYTPIKTFCATEMGAYYSHIVLIPLVSLYLICLKRKEVLANPKYSFTIGIPVLIAGIGLFFGGRILGADFDKNNFASLIALSVVIFVNGSFILTYGLQAYRTALFPLLFLIFIIPIPTALMEGIINFLRVGSTEFTNLLFMASGVPFVRDGFTFHLPNISVEVAKQCSGIRSAMAIFITAILAGYLFLKSTWKIAFLVFCAVLIAMFKNGIRIITLSLLGNYVDPRILQSSLHREGGVPFFIVALFLMAPILFFLMRSEKKKSNK